MISTSYSEQQSDLLQSTTDITSKQKTDAKIFGSLMKVFRFRHKRTLSSVSAEIMKDESLVVEDSPSSQNIYRKMSQDTEPTESGKITYSTSTLRRKKRRAPQPSVVEVNRESSSEMIGSSITDQSCCRDTIKLETVVTITTVTTATKDRNQVEQLLLSESTDEEDEE